MIGGVDVVFETQVERAVALELCARLIMSRWPGAVLENALTTERYAGVAEIPFAHVSELMVYRDQAAFESWQRLGADPANANTMVHLLAYEEGELTAVVDDPVALEMRALLEEMTKGLGAGEVQQPAQSARNEQEERRLQTRRALMSALRERAQRAPLPGRAGGEGSDVLRPAA
jgi:hypothetical protein